MGNGKLIQDVDEVGAQKFTVAKWFGQAREVTIIQARHKNENIHTGGK